MIKAVGVLIIGLGVIMVVIGIQGTQSQLLANLKTLNPKLRTLTGTSNASTTGTTGTQGITGGAGSTGGLGSA